MNARVWGIIGGVALALALLSPLVLGSAKKVARLYEAAETFYERADYENAILNYEAALKEARKPGANTKRIDTDFTTLATFKIARCYYEKGEKSQDDRDYELALIYILKVEAKATIPAHKEDLAFLHAQVLYKKGDLEQATLKYGRFITDFPNSRYAARARWTQGEIAYQQENYDAARAVFTDVVNRFPNSEFKGESERRIADIDRIFAERKERETANIRTADVTLDDTENTTPAVPVEPEPEDEAQVLYNRAADLKAEGRIHDAYKSYTALIEEYPDSEYVADAYIHKAEIHLEADDLVNARANYEEAMWSTEDGQQRAALYKKYQLTYLVPKYADGKKRGRSQENVLRFIDATQRRKAGKFLEAAKLYEQLAESDLPAEETAEALYWAGYCYHKAAAKNLNLFNTSVTLFKKLMQQYDREPVPLNVYYQLAAVYADWAEVSKNIARWQSVLDTVRTAYAAYPEDGSIQTRGWLSRLRELEDRALAKLSPTPQRPQQPAKPIENKAEYITQGREYLNRGELEKATASARRALKMERNYEPALRMLYEIRETHYGRGWTFIDEEQYNKAIKSLKNAIDIDENFEKAHAQLGFIYLEQEEWHEAVTVLEKAVYIDPDYTEANFNLGIAYMKLGKFSRARAAAQAVLAVTPDHEGARILLEYIED